MASTLEARASEAAPLLARFESWEAEAAGAGAPPAANRRVGLVAAALLARDREDLLLVGGAREWALPLLLGAGSPDELLNLGRFGPGGHAGMGARVLGTHGRPGGQLARALGAALAGRPTLALCGTGAVVEQLSVLAAAGTAELPLVILALGEELPGSVPGERVTALARACGWAASEGAGDVSALMPVLAEALDSDLATVVAWDCAGGRS